MKENFWNDENEIEIWGLFVLHLSRYCYPGSVSFSFSGRRHHPLIWAVQGLNFSIFDKGTRMTELKI